MNWLVEDMSSNRNKIFGNWHDRQLYLQREGNQKLLKNWHEKNLVKMRTFIQENKDNNANIEQGFDTYKNDIDDYIRILREEGLRL
jgi:hypothetical protein